ncbi:MAG TPA: CPBP family glutamic-type intramembrane protease [Dermatophilaceae bacterium]|nr:CPBP family glutamic-type intramembrane protease [Dermatophilaceae bacterium]
MRQSRSDRSDSFDSPDATGESEAKAADAAYPQVSAPGSGADEASPFAQAAGLVGGPAAEVAEAVVSSAAVGRADTPAGALVPAPPADRMPPRSSWARRQAWLGSLRTVDDQFLRRVERDQRDTDAQWRRRRVVAALTLLAGAIGLAASLRMSRDSPLFPLAALGVAAIWAGGAFASGKLHLGRIAIGDELRRPVIQPILAGLALAAIFIGGAYVTRLIPPLADQARSVLAFAQYGSLLALTVTTALSGIAEEVFFRGALYAAVKDGRQVWVTTALYAVATALTGNVMLAFAAVVLGVVTARQRWSTGGILAPILTHITWSMCMLHVLPLIF